MQRVFPVPVLAVLAAVFCFSLMAGCGGSSSANNKVTQLILTPTTSSMNQGAVTTLSVTAENSGGTAIAADISFTSSNTAVATVSTGGLICAGQWDSSFINCNFTAGSGIGQVTITATATAYNVSATMTVYVHEQVNLVLAGLPNSCTSMGQTVNISGAAFSTTAPGCSTTAPCNISTTVGPFTFGSNDTNVVSYNSSTGVLTAGSPGTTTVFASVSGVNSVGTPYTTCPVSSIFVHSATGSQTSFTLGTGGTQPLTADVFDTNGQYIKPTLNWGSSSTATATVAPTGTVNNPGTITAVNPGTAYITASCDLPNCNLGLPPLFSQNVVTATVSGGAGTYVYAASSNSTTLVPFNVSNDALGTAITLPYAPNSIIADPAGTNVYLGSGTALMAVNISTGAVTTYAAPGVIEAISANSQNLLVFDSTSDTVSYFDLSSGAVSAIQGPVSLTSGAYAPDSEITEWVAGTQLGVGLSSGPVSVAVLPNPANTMDIMAQGGLTYITAATARQIYVYSTCDATRDQVLSATSPTLVKAIPNGTGAVAVDAPNVDVISTPSLLSPGCPVTTQSTIAAYDLGAGSFNAQQAFVSPDATRVWIASSLPEILTFYLPSLTPNLIPLAGGATPYNGGITMDSAHAYFGTSDGTVHRIDTAALSDVAQIAVGLKDGNGNPTVPNLVCVVP